jgi:CheY-like chemotaxis protein
VALPAGTGDAGWLRAFDAVVPPLRRAFRPDIVVSQHGCDTHRLDPLPNLQLSIDAQRVAHAAIHHLVHEVAGGRWVLTGGGGYELLEVVPRTWTHLLAEAAGCPIDPGARVPAAWREYASRRTGREAPQTMRDGTEPEFARFESGYDLTDQVDQAVLDVRLPDGDGVSVCRQVRSRAPEVACLMLTAFSDDEALLASIMAGAAGYVLKQIRGSDLAGAVRVVASGRSLLDPRAASQAMARLRDEANGHDRLASAGNGTGFRRLSGRWNIASSGD